MRSALRVFSAVTLIMVMAYVAYCEPTEDELALARENLSTGQFLIAAGKLTEGQAKLDLAQAIAEEHLAQRWQFAAALKAVVQAEQADNKVVAATALKALSGSIAEPDQGLAVVTAATRLVLALAADDETKAQAVSLLTTISASPLKDQEVFWTHAPLVASWMAVGDMTKAEAQLVKSGSVAKTEGDWQFWGVTASTLMGRMETLDDQLALFGRLAPVATTEVSKNGLRPMADRLLWQAREASSRGDAQTSARITTALGGNAGIAQDMASQLGVATELASVRTLLEAEDYAGARTALSAAWNQPGERSDQEAEMVYRVGTALLNKLFEENRQQDAQSTLNLLASGPGPKVDPWLFNYNTAVAYRKLGDTAKALTALNVAVPLSQAEGQKAPLVSETWLLAKGSEGTLDSLGVYDGLSAALKEAGLAEGLLKKYVDNLKVYVTADWEPEKLAGATERLNALKERAAGMNGLAGDISIVEGLVVTRAISMTDKEDAEVTAALDSAYDAFKDNAEMMPHLSGQVQLLLTEAITEKRVGLAEALVKFYSKEEVLNAIAAGSAEDREKIWAGRATEVIRLGDSFEEKARICQGFLAATEAPTAQRSLCKMMLDEAEGQFRYAYNKPEQSARGVVLLEAVQERAANIEELAPLLNLVKERKALAEDFQAEQYTRALTALKNIRDLVKEDPAAAASFYYEGVGLLQVLLESHENEAADAFLQYLSQKELVALAGSSQPWINIARSFSYTRGREEWLAYADQRIAECGEDPNSRAFWLMGKACMKKLDYKGRSEPRKGLRWVEEAMTITTSPSMRLNAALELTDYYEEMKRCQVGISVLESIKGQYSGEELAKIEKRQEYLRQVDADNVASAEASRLARNELQRQGMLNYYNKRLAVAQAEGDQEKVAKITAAIAQLEAAAPQE